MIKLTFVTLFMSIHLLMSANDILALCWAKQSQALTEDYLSFHYEELENGFSHSMNPWDQYSYDIKGALSLNCTSLFKVDTLTTKSQKKYFSKVQFDNNLLLFEDYGSTELSEVNQPMVRHQLIKSCRYSPSLILDYFYQNIDRVKVESLPTLSVFHTQIFEFRVSLYVDQTEAQVVKIRVLSDLESDDQYYGFGDVVDEFNYSDYRSIDDLNFPTRITISKLNGKLEDIVSIISAERRKVRKDILERPVDHEFSIDPIKEVDITVEKYTENIFLINLHHCGTRSLMVEFEEYVFVAESPLNSKNGELLLKEVHKIAPDKPVKYFAFGHFHPHYTGGMRPFIHKGAEIICVEEDQSYVEFIANASYSINLDSLQMDPKEVKFGFVDEQKTIKDQSMEMVIYHIGNKSNHTNDYLIYYFPGEKMLFQDDLVRLNRNSTKENLSKTTIGLYDAIKELGIEVHEIVQNWHVFDKSNPMKFKFQDIEDIMEEEK